MSNLKSYRSCFVPLCKNTTKATPGKMFLNVPQDEKRRNKWFQAVHRDNPKTKSNFFCCEDHFDLKDDMENYIYYTTMGGKAKIKIDVTPHKFDCKSNRKRQGTPAILRPAAGKRRRQQIIKKKSSKSSSNRKSDNPVEKIDSDSLNVTPDQKVTVGTQTINNSTVAVQMNSRLKYRSVSVQCNILSLGVNKSCSPIKTTSISIATSPIKTIASKIRFKCSRKCSKKLVI